MNFTIPTNPLIYIGTLVMAISINETIYALKIRGHIRKWEKNGKVPRILGSKIEAIYKRVDLNEKEKGQLIYEEIAKFVHGKK